MCSLHHFTLLIASIHNVLICNAGTLHACLTEDPHAQVNIDVIYKSSMHLYGCNACVSILSKEYVPTAVSNNISHPAEMLPQ